MSLAYPHPYFWEIEKQTIPVTAGTVDINLSPGVGYRWIILYGYIQLVADANAANRELKIRIEDTGGNLIGPSWTPAAAVTAGQTRTTTLGQGGALIKGVSTESVVHVDVGFIMIEGTDQITITVLAGLAGDEYSGSIHVLKIRT